MKIEILKDVIANVNGKSVRFKSGDRYAVPNPDGDNLVRGGYAKKLPHNARVKKIEVERKPLNTKTVRGK